MESEVPSCGVCSLEYDSDERAPRILVECGHTLCTRCLSIILGKPSLRKCPFDNKSLKGSHGSLDSFPFNFALKDLVEERNKNLCPVHRQRAALICLTDKTKICHECVVFGDHVGHKIKRMKEVKDQGVEKKKSLQEGLQVLDKCQSEDDALFEQMKNNLLDTMKDRFGEIKLILNTKELEWHMHVSNLFAPDRTSILGSRKSGLKRQVFEAMKEIDETCKNDDFLAILDKDYGELTSKLQPKLLRGHSQRIDAKACEMLSSIDGYLDAQRDSIIGLELPSKMLKREMCVENEGEEPSEKGLEEIEKTLKVMRVKSRFELENGNEACTISVGGSYAKDLEVDLEKMKDVKEIRVELARYDRLAQDDLSVLYYILHGLEKYSSLTVTFEHQGLNDEHLLKLSRALFCDIQHLEEIVVNLENCHITDKSMTMFCNKMLPKAGKLKSLTLHLHSSHVSNASLAALAKCMEPLKRNLEIFSLGLYNTQINDEGIKEVFGLVETVKTLELQLQKTKITNKSLKIFGENVLPCLKVLDDFTLHAGETKVSDEGILPILKNLQNMKVLKMGLFHTHITDKFVDMFMEETLPRMKALTGLDLELERTKIGAENLNKIAKLMEQYEQDEDEEEEEEEAEGDARSDGEEVF